MFTKFPQHNPLQKIGDILIKYKKNNLVSTTPAKWTAEISEKWLHNFARGRTANVILCRVRRTIIIVWSYTSTCYRVNVMIAYIERYSLNVCIDVELGFVYKQRGEGEDRGLGGTTRKNTKGFIRTLSQTHIYTHTWAMCLLRV